MMAKVDPIQVKVAIEVIEERLTIFDRQAEWLAQNYPYWAPEIAGSRLRQWLLDTRAALNQSPAFRVGRERSVTDVR